MTKVTMAFCVDRTDTKGSWKARTHIWTESEDGDSVRTHNVMNKQILAAIDEWVANHGGEDSVVREPPNEALYDGMCIRVFDIYLEAVPSSNKNVPYIRVDYKKYPNCPLKLVSRFMDVVAGFRRDLKAIRVK